MGYEELWKVLADLLTELRRRGETIPARIMKDLRSAKTMIQILKADPTRTENLPRIEAYLENVESYLIFTAQDKLGSEYGKEYMRKLEEARRTISEAETIPSRFVPGLPRGRPWVRIQVSEETPQKYIESLAEEEGLSYKMQEDGYILVYGDRERIRSLVRKMAENLHDAR